MKLDLRELARKGLQAELTRLDAERVRIVALLAELGGKARASAAATQDALPRARTMSPEGRRRIQDAVRRRWERVRAEQAAAGKQAEVAAAATAASDTSEPAEATAPSARRRRGAPKRSGGRKK